MKNADNPAQPTTMDNIGSGLTKREQIAAMAMQGILSDGYYTGPMDAANDAVRHADALLERLETEQS